MDTYSKPLGLSYILFVPVFFIQDAMKFPDLIHAAKPEPYNQMPQAETAHDTFWDLCR
jgi:catalase